VGLRIYEGTAKDVSWKKRRCNDEDVWLFPKRITLSALHSAHNTQTLTHTHSPTNKFDFKFDLLTKMPTSLFWLSLSEFEGKFKISIKKFEPGSCGSK